MRPRSRAGSDGGVRHYGSDDEIDPRHLVAGTTVRRYTEPAPGGQLDVAVPCCARTARLPEAGHQLRTAVGCPFCTMLYTATIIDELDGGYAALFEIRAEPIVLARRRPRRATG